MKTLQSGFDDNLQPENTNSLVYTNRTQFVLYNNLHSILFDLVSETEQWQCNKIIEM